ncbi:MAG: VWA domain-containing protein [Myxococcales bacterium]|nr:VWA domain-containing protein [Myxococcales bacterium]
MFFGFLEELRGRKVPVGLHEAIALAAALLAGLHDSSLEGFYYVARSLLVHSEVHLDAFDQAFAKHFRGAEDAAVQLTAELLEWLEGARRRARELTPEEAALLGQFDREELERLLRERLAEQRGRHDGGNRWIGTGGTSPFGHSGAPRDGIRIGGAGGNRRAVQVASARLFRDYRADVVLDTRQMTVALRKLRAFAREGAPCELDLEGTIERTAKNAGELEVVTRAPRRPNTRVILMMDVGGSMDPYAELVSRLFSAARKATHFKELRTYYFHNCVYGRVYQDARLKGGVPLRELFAECGKHYKLILAGDALMAPYELLERTDESGWYHPQGVEGLAWLARLAEHFPRSVWLNPEPPGSWGHTTIEVIAGFFPMFPLTLEGLGEAVARLARGAVAGAA